MCGGGGGDGGAGAAAEAEKKRQAKINAGTAAIDRIFNGYDTGINPINANPDYAKTYYLTDGTPVTVLNREIANPNYTAPLDNNSMSLSNAVRRERVGKSSTVPRMIRQDQLFSGGKQVGVFGKDAIFGDVTHKAGFDNNYYGGIEKAYTDYASPQLDDQKTEALRQLGYALDRRGLSASSAAGSEQAKLEKQYAKYKTDIASGAKGYADKARSDNEATRGTLISQLVATENPGAVETSALRYTAAQSRPPSFDPVGQFVFNVSEGLKQQSDNNGGRPLFDPLNYGASSGGNVSYVRK